MFFKREGKIDITAERMEQLIRGEEVEANLMISSILLLISAGYFALWIVFKANNFHISGHVDDIVFLGSCILLLIACTVCQLLKGEGRWLKNVLIFLFAVSVLAANIVTGYKVWLLYAIPIILSCRYTNTRFTATVGVIVALLAVAAGFCSVYVSPLLGYYDLDTVEYNHDVALHAGSSPYDSVAASNIDFDAMLQTTFKLSVLPNLILVACTTAAAISLIRHDRHLVAAAAKSEQDRADLEVELERGRAKLMVSQIQPHFLYNSLSSIAAIDGNPGETVDAISAFGKYLRGNMDSLTSDDVIPFDREMEHVRHYVSLEKLRFQEKIDIIYDLQANNFACPPLSVQVLVENAIKHGVSKTVEGGTVRISTRDAGGEWLVIVEDDGTGFDTSAPIDKTKHVGLANVRTRLQSYCNGDLEIESEPGEGTTVTVHIPKANLMQPAQSTQALQPTQEEEG